MNCSTPGFSVHHYIPEFPQTHVHWVGDAIQTSHPVFPFSFALNFSQHQVFSNESALCIRWPKYWSFNFSISPSNEYSGLISFRMDWLDLFVVQGTLKSQWIRLWLHVYDWNSTDSYELKWLWTVISVEWSYPELLANTEKLQNFS